MIQFLKRTEKTHLKEVDTYESGCWVYAEAPSLDELLALNEQLGLDEGHLHDALDEDEQPRFEREGDQLYIFTRFAYTDEQSQIQTTPLLIVMTKSFLLTVSAQPIPLMERFLAEKVAFQTNQPDQLMIKLLHAVTEQYDRYLSQTSRQIKSIRARLRVEEITNRDFIDFVLIEDVLNEFLAALTPTTSILKRLLISKHLRLTEDDKDLIEDLQLGNEQSIEVAKSSIKSIINIREAYATIMSNNLNRVIRILTVLTVLLAVPTLITSMYGMNVGLPFMNNSAAFWIVLVFSTVLSGLLLAFFKIKRWL